MASKEQVNFIRKEAKEGKSANQIQKDLQEHHMGMKRQRLLEYVREYKGQKPKAEPSKYTPKKYRRARVVRHIEIGKKLAVYGSVNWQSRRVQMSGSGKELYSAMMLVGKHPPKKRFLTTNAKNIIENPDEYLDMEEEWDRKEVESR